MRANDSATDTTAIAVAAATAGTAAATAGAAGTTGTVGTAADAADASVTATSTATSTVNATANANAVPADTTPTDTTPTGVSWRGSVLAALGVASFSLTFPGTAWALEGMGPWTVVMLRTVVAGGCLLAFRVRPPERRHRAGLAVVALGVVFGFPLLTTLALRTSTTAHSAVIVGLLPLTTAAFSAVRTGARPSRAFWCAALAGAVVVIGFAVQQSGDAPSGADVFLFIALVVCAAGYTEGGRLARLKPGWQVISWALVMSLPLATIGSTVALSAEPVHLGGHAVAGLLWLGLGSQFLGLVVWYRGMAAVGVSKASQLQLAQPLLTLV